MKLWTRRDPDPYASVARGQELKAGADRDGVVDDGLIAYPERVKQAARQWAQASAEHFEATGTGRRRRWIDKRGIEYRAVGGCALLSLGTAASAPVACFIIEDARLVFLRRSDVAEEFSVHHGPVVGRQITSAEPDEEWRIR